MISYICFKLLALSIDGGLAVFSLRPVEMLSWKFPFIAMQYILFVGKPVYTVSALLPKRPDSIAASYYWFLGF